ncbi:MAG: fimbria/pilus outer membrane usher protein [Cypionkella sp.]
MAPRPRPADGLLALLAAAAAALGGTPAAAQSDPFALPRGLTAQSVQPSDGPGLSEIAVDGEVMKRLVPLAWQGSVLTIDADAARVAGLPVADSAKGMVALDKLALAKWQFDALRQRLEVQLLRKSDKGNYIDLHAGPAMRGESAAITALRIDYDVSATLARGRSAAAGYFDAALVRGNLALGATMQVATRPAEGARTFIRLDTTLRLQVPRAGLTLSAGDFVSAGGQSQRALRMGGVQLGSDYSLRPDLVTIPLPSFSGQVAVPTGIDLINGDQRTTLGQVEPGEFTVRNIPAQLGRGEVAVVTRDALGREVVQAARFYVSRNLLARNLSEFAVNAGFVRRRYGTASHDYGPLAGSIFYRRGISSQLTLEASAEWTAGLFNAGVRGDVALGGLALLTAEARYSHDSASGRSGHLLNLGVESSGSRLSGRIGATLPSAGYRDVASKLGDPAPPRLYVAQIGFDLGSFNRIQLSASRQETSFDPRYPTSERRIDVVNAALRMRISRAIDAFGSVGYRRGAASGAGFTAFTGVSIQLGHGRSSQITASKGSNAPFAGAATMRQYDIEGQPLGYALERTSGQAGRTAGSLAYRAGFARFEGEVERVRGTFAARANARGTLIVAGGGVFARNRTGGTYALVRTGKVDAVPVMRENRPAGMTGRNGLLLVENIPPQVAIGFDVDADKLPLDALARDVRKRVVVPRGAVALVALDVIRFVPRQVRVVDAAGAPLAAGLVARALPSGETSLVGFDGVVEINAGSEDRELAIGTGDRACTVALGGIDLTGPERAPLTCTPGVPAAAPTVVARAGERGPGSAPRRRDRPPVSGP